MIESMTIQMLQVVLSGIVHTGRLAAAGQPFDAYSAVEAWLTGFAMAALIISLILVFFLSAKHQRSLENFRRQIDGLTAHIDELRQKIAELGGQTPTKMRAQMPSEEAEELVGIQKS
jgi:hypothetical protein